MDGAQVRVLRATTFMVSDQQGDIRPEPGAETGLFFRDMRHLSQWEIRIDGRLLEPVSGEAIAQNEAVFFLAEETGSLAAEPAYTLVRQRRIAADMVESLRLTSHDNTFRTMLLTILVDADFVDVMHVPLPQRRSGHLYHQVGPRTLTFGYRRGDFQRRTVLTAEDAFLTPRAICFQVGLEPGQTWEREVRLTVEGSDGVPADESFDASAADWLRDAPRLDSANGHLNDTYQRSIEDLVALRWQTDVGALTVPGAGLPKFMTLYGRDSLLTAHQALPFLPQICRDTLRVLAAYQSSRTADATDAEPGKIPHELRLGEVAAFGDQPYNPYYGSVDSTPLFVIMLDEYERWTGDADTVRELEEPARAALAWLRVHADRDERGFLCYHTRNPEHGLANQCWKDSDDSIVHPDGSLARLPRATCEVQGYAYDARRRAARLAREFWSDPDLGRELDREADLLREAFIAAYWLPDERFYALALDGVGDPVRTLTSNIGHLLWSGIVPDEHVEPVVEHLMSDRLFSGWGIRTLGENHLAYNPMGYHTGSVWPHDTAITALGLARYERWEEARTLAEAGLIAAAHMGHRLPEALIGTARDVTRVPVTLPGAAWPHAWSCGAPLLMLRAALGLEPTGTGPAVRSANAIGGITLHNLPGRWGHATIQSAGDTADYRIRDVAGEHL
jgi:glycogen debranching enzyme